MKLPRTIIFARPFAALAGLWHRFFDAASSLKLTLAALSAALVLVFAGTLAQVHLGTHVVQERYFQSLFVWWPMDSSRFQIPIFPGGHLLGGILLVNLLAAHLRRFRLAWRNLGTHLTHGGLIIMLAGGLLTDLFSRESTLRLSEGETANYSEDPQRVELAVIDQKNKAFDQVTAIPEEQLHAGRTLTPSSLPFRILVKSYYKNSELGMLGQAGAGATAAADQGVGARVTVKERPQATAANARDVASAVIQIVPIPSGDGITPAPLGSWLVSDALGAPQTFSFQGGAWRLELRPARYYKPFSITLKKFTHERYAGTDIPKNFASQISLTDPKRGVNREVLIYMNHPLRYGGETFYQSGFEGEHTTVLQVVRNPSFVAPYVACLVIGAGLLIQFSQHFAQFTRRKKSLQ